MSKQINYWQRLCAIPRFGFIHSPDNSRIIKAEGLGSWIDRDEAMKIMDAAQDEISALQAENAELRRQLEQAGQRGVPEVVEVMRFQLRHSFSGEEHAVEFTRVEVADLIEDSLYDKLAPLVCRCDDADHECGDYIHDFDLVMAAPVPPAPAEAKRNGNPCLMCSGHSLIGHPYEHGEICPACEGSGLGGRAETAEAAQPADSVPVPRDVLLNMLAGSESHECGGGGECPVCMAEDAAADLLAGGRQ